MFDRGLRWLLLTLIPMLVLTLAPARVFADVAGAADYASFQRFPGATIVDGLQPATGAYAACRRHGRAKSG